MDVVIDTMLVDLHYVVVRQGYNQMRFTFIGDRGSASHFAGFACGRFQECLTKLQHSAQGGMTESFSIPVNVPDAKSGLE